MESNLTIAPQMNSIGARLVFILAICSLLFSCDGAFVRRDRFDAESGQVLGSVELEKVRDIVESYGLVAVSIPRDYESIFREFDLELIAWFDVDKEPIVNRGSLRFVSISQVLDSNWIEIEVHSFPDSSRNKNLLRLREEIVSAMNEAGWQLVSN